MSIVVTLSPELEALLRDKAAQQGQDVSLVASEMLANVLEWEEQDSVEAIEGIQKGLDDFKVGRFRSFQEFTEEQSRKHKLSADARSTASKFQVWQKLKQTAYFSDYPK